MAFPAHNLPVAGCLTAALPALLGGLPAEYKAEKLLQQTPEQNCEQNFRKGRRFLRLAPTFSARRRRRRGGLRLVKMPSFEIAWRTDVLKRHEK